MRGAGKMGMIGLTIVGGGMALGVLLSSFANPVMKRAPEPDWRLTGRPAIESGPVQHFVSLPEDLSPPSGYRPDLDYDAEISDWSPTYPRWTYADLESPDSGWFESEPAYVDEPPQPKREATATLATVTERAESASEASQEGHRIARVQADGLW
jgi:hypothetical protein